MDSCGLDPIVRAEVKSVILTGWFICCGVEHLAFCSVNDSITQVYSVSAFSAYVLGGFLIGHIADHCFVGKLKSLLLIVTAVDTMTFLACTVRGDSSDFYCLLLLVLIS